MNSSSRKIKEACVAGGQPARGGLLRRTGERTGFLLDVFILRCTSIDSDQEGT